MRADNLSMERSKPSNYGWVIVGVVFLAELLAFGLVYSFGIFFKPLASEFHWSRAAIAGVFSVYAIIHVVLAPVAGIITDRFGPKIIAILAGFFVGLAMLLMSRATTIWQVYLFFGFVFSIGIACVYAPLIGVTSRWFTERRGLAVGITATGLGAGALIFNPLSAWLISSYGWRTAYTIVGIICWVLFIPIIKFIKETPKKKSTGVEIEKEASKDFTVGEALRTRTFWIISFAWLLMAISLWAIAVHLPLLLTDTGISLMMAGTVAGVMGGLSAAGRVGMGFISDRIGRKRSILIGCALQLIALVFLLSCHELWMFFLFAAVLGLGSGSWAGTMPSLPADLFGVKATATILGFMVMFVGIGVAIGSFAGGRIYDVTGSYNYMIWMCIFTSVVAIIFASLIKAPAR